MTIREKIFLIIVEMIIVLLAVRLGVSIGRQQVNVIDSGCYFIEKHGVIVGPVYLA